MTPPATRLSSEVEIMEKDELRCEDIMKRDVATVSPSDSIHDAARIMRDRGIGFLPVCDEQGKAVGTITDRDITIRVSADARDVDECHVSDVMTKDVVTCRPEDSLSRAQDLMASRKVSRMLVADDQGRVEGVISLSDIAERETEASAARTLRAVSSREARAPSP